MVSKVFKIKLVRHGQTTHNKLKIIQGQMETDLTELGRSQAKLLCKYLDDNKFQFDKVYSSDLKRAHETCEIICNGKYQIHDSQLLRERSFGLLQGMPLDMLRSQAYKAGHDESNFTQFRPEGGETMEEVQDRIQRFCKNELFPNAKQSDHILIVTHGGVIKEFMKLFRKYACPLDNKDLIITPNTSMNDFDIELTPELKVNRVVPTSLHAIPHLTQEARDEALNEEQLNESTTKKKNEVEYAI